ncbi:hypothetical protein AN639_09960 [Candidatus Epulonipiscium fishelsonii]|uniref:Uncharacterized protein n=1 Tax=Candidatus Epulonipiscium fishelsonii TaxID=77094 RepID=A0ACC8XA09_9FIRM|nr:hypothetical protein AN396_09640 [Epulopiscium sp. SCG-B11WGA-EpuloA1]ONI43761.1 hypothetical protein AN639_09960 [Epulopiscium sp. SCG-B05WGA-EpuloA1]
MLQDLIDEKTILTLKLYEEMRTAEIMQELLKIFKEYPGHSKIQVKYMEDGTIKFFPKKYNIKISEKIIHELTKIVGKECIVITKFIN